MTGRSSPIRSAKAARNSGVARGPSMMVTRSPGTNFISMNRKSMAPAMVSTAATSLNAMNLAKPTEGRNRPFAVRPP